MQGWANQGIPLKVAEAGIDRYFERYYRKGPRRRPVRIEFCEADVLDAFDDWRRAVGVARVVPDPPAGRTSRSRSRRRGRAVAGVADRGRAGAADGAARQRQGRAARSAPRSTRRCARSTRCGRTPRGRAAKRATRCCAALARSTSELAAAAIGGARRRRADRAREGSGRRARAVPRPHDRRGVRAVAPPGRAAPGAPAFRLAELLIMNRGDRYRADDRAAGRRRPDDRAPRGRDRVRVRRDSRRGRRGGDRKGAARHGVGDRPTRCSSRRPIASTGAPDGACGGSVFAHIAYERQRAIKAAIIDDAFRRIGRITLDAPAEVVGVAGRRLPDARAPACAQTAGSGSSAKARTRCAMPGRRGSCATTPSTCCGGSKPSLATLRARPVGEIELSENIDATERALSPRAAAGRRSVAAGRADAGRRRDRRDLRASRAIRARSSCAARRS